MEQQQILRYSVLLNKVSKFSLITVQKKILFNLVIAPFIALGTHDWTTTFL
jgi:hypothetical protein